MSTSSYRFGPYRLDARTRTLRGGNNDVIALTAKQSAVLLAIVSRLGEAADKDTLLKEAWPGLTVTENNLAQQVRALRKKLGKDDSNREYIQNATNQGYSIPGAIIECIDVDSSHLDQDLEREPESPVLPHGPASTRLRSTVQLATALLILIGIFAVASFRAAYGSAIVASALICLLSAVVYTRSEDTPFASGAMGLLIASVMAYIPSAATLFQVMQTAVNAQTLTPAFVYPFITGLKFLPLFVVVLVYWVLLGLNGDDGFRRRSFLRTGYIVLGLMCLFLTVFFLIRNSGDDLIWSKGLPGYRSLFAFLYSFDLVTRP